ncbi:MAG: 3-phosphoserine/phosphohydroxythreonine transaminase [Fimbriimonas sp.]
MPRIFNFSAGPSTLPLPVLEQAQAEMLDYRGTGMSVMEMSHRSAAFEGILGEAEANLRALLGVPEGYKVLFLQGGASLQFAMIPMAFLPSGRRAEYVVTGAWGQKAIESARTVGEACIAWDGAEDGYRSVPHEISSGADAAYVHITSNETIHGVQFPSDPQTAVPLVCDMSSDILSRPVDVSRYSLIYAGAQKNMGPAGATVVIVREDLLSQHKEGLAPMLDYRVHVKNGSMYNTPTTWSIYVCGLVYRYLLDQGGLQGAQARNEAKAGLLYAAIDGSDGFYRGHAARDARSQMNVVFTLREPSLTDAFVCEAEAAGFDGLKGHRSTGGCRASVYNAFPLEGCRELAGFMEAFAHRHA